MLLLVGLHLIEKEGTLFPKLSLFVIIGLSSINAMAADEFERRWNARAERDKATATANNAVRFQTLRDQLVLSVGKKMGLRDTGYVYSPGTMGALSGEFYLAGGRIVCKQQATIGGVYFICLDEQGTVLASHRVKPNRTRP